MQHQVGATNPTSAPEKFRKLDPSTFKGTKDPIEADNWLRELERLFRAMKVSSSSSIRLTIPCVPPWWNHLSKQYNKVS